VTRWKAISGTIFKNQPFPMGKAEKSPEIAFKRVLSFSEEKYFSGFGGRSVTTVKAGKLDKFIQQIFGSFIHRWRLVVRMLGFPYIV